MGRLDAESETLLPCVAPTIEAVDGRKWGSNQWVNNGKAIVSIQDVTPREKSQNGKGWNDDGSAYTVDTHATQGVAQPIGTDVFNGTITGEVAATMGTRGSSQNASGPTVMQPIGLDEEQNAMIDGFGTLKARTAGGGFEGTVMQTNMVVRRLTPVECERLQGFPDNYTNIKDKCPDGPRYKALGNSWAVPVVRWIGERINAMA
jgi:site-specific DNA-cytosine methylase